jgi:hypothetical protein
MFTSVRATTGIVVIVKVADFDPADTITLAGTAVEESLLVKDTTAPLGGAAPVSVTVAFADAPPTIDVGFREMAESTGGATVSVSVFMPLYVPEIVTGVDVATGTVVIAKFTDEAPPATITLAGTVVEGSLLLRSTARPPDGAAELRVTVPVAERPPTTVCGLTAIFEILNGTTVSVAWAVLLL